jgi:hypothetical protein
MWWIVIGVAVLVLVGWFEWRSRNKPLPPGLNGVWGVGENADRPITGGTDFGGKRD